MNVNRWLIPLFSFLVGVCVLCAGAQTETFDQQLYFESHGLSDSAHRLEWHPFVAVDFAHPFLNLYSLGTGFYYAIDPLWAIGAEASVFANSRRSTLDELEQALKEYGLQLSALPPRWSTVAVVRVTPVSNLTNAFSSGPVVSDVRLGLRAGMINNWFKVAHTSFAEKEKGGTTTSLAVPPDPNSWT